MKNDPNTPVGFARHDHGACIASALTLAEARCRDTGAQLTPVRRRALEILLESHVALGAYDVLARLAEDGFGSKPPVAYRALSFLVEQGFAHRIEKLNAYVACTHPGEAHDAAFMICRNCHKVAEAEVDATLGENGFIIENIVIEAEGLCPICRDEGAV